MKCVILCRRNKRGDKMSHIIKKYSNRKMYDTKASKPITLAGIAALIVRGDDVQVVDNQTGDDLTMVTLAQIILEQEKSKKELLSLPVLLREMIKRGRESLSEIIEKLLLSSTESALLTEEKAREVVQDLVEKKRLGKPEGQRLLERIFSKVRERQRALQGQIETGIREILGKMDIVSQAELQELRRSLQELRCRVDALANLKNK
ncbi:MAG: hypothetical protein DRQ24_02145 [Candidatus Latescibacterota bacterium]|nr:MAG: hypothetical protein DRQ24_02145 [Candidatus Latescibacterota bacterium]